jgi:hypothetical protein
VKHVVRIGQDVKLKCSIESFPPPLFSWSKEGETIDFTWDRSETIHFTWNFTWDRSETIDVTWDRSETIDFTRNTL